MSNTNNQFSFLDYTGLSLFWSKVKKIISDNESATTTSLKNLDTRVNTLETKVANQAIPLSVGSVSTAVQQDTSTASGEYSFAEGYYTNASNNLSHAEGMRTIASGQASHAEGGATEAKNRAEHAEGMFNISIQDKTIHTVGIGRLSDNKNAHEIHVDGKHYIFGIGGYDGTNSQTAGIKTVQEVISDIQDKMINISYNDLVVLRNNSKLVPGQQYRITDYTCTTRQDKTISAGHKFDIIVTADSTNKLNEEARAIQHTGDTYFADCNLSAWKIWYCLDNDADRFTWALGNERYITVHVITNGMTYYARYLKTEIIDGTTYDLWDFGSVGGYIGTSNTTGQSCDLIRNDNGTLYLYNSGAGKIIDSEGASGGKGVIYRMIDEWNNDVPYDFKNIQYTGSWGYYAYTFNWINDGTDNSCEDLSVAQFAHLNDESGYNHTWANIIKPCGENTAGVYSYPFKLNQCIFLNTESYDGGLFYGCYANTFGNGCYNNTFGNICYNNSFGNRCYTNTFGNSCYNNTFGNSCYNNTFGSSCYTNTFGNSCDSNTFGNICNNNTFGNSCDSNTFGNLCYNNTFGNICDSNTFGNSCFNNTFGNSCDSNTFGNSCDFNTFGNCCKKISVGNNIEESQFGDGVQYFSITSSRITTTPPVSYMKSYIRWLIVENGIRYANAYVNSPTSSSLYCQNVRICQGCSGTSSTYKSFAIDNINSNQQLIFCYDSTGGERRGNIGDLFK